MEHNEALSTYTRSDTTLMSDDVRALAADLIKAKRHYKATGKSGSNLHQKYDYATIGDILGAVETALGDNNIWIFQSASPYNLEGPNKIELLTTRLIHAPTGQWMQDVRYLEYFKPGNQGKGEAQTYMRKVAILALCGLCPSDDDGEDEKKHISSDKSHQYREAGYLALKYLIKTAPDSKVAYEHVLKKTGKDSIEAIPPSEIFGLLEYLKKNINDIK